MKSISTNNFVQKRSLSWHEVISNKLSLRAVTTHHQTRDHPSSWLSCPPSEQHTNKPRSSSVMISLPARCALLAVHDMPAGQPQAGLVHLAPRNHACCMGAGGRQGRHCQFQDSSQLMHAHRPIKLFPCRTATLPGQGGTGGQDANMVIGGGGRSPGREPLS